MAYAYGSSSMSKNNNSLENTQGKNQKGFVPSIFPHTQQWLCRTPDSWPSSLCSNTLSDGHLITSQSHPFHIRQLANTVQNSFPLLNNSTNFLWETGTSMWLWWASGVVCCSLACLSSHPFLAFPLPLSVLQWRGPDPIGPPSQVPMSAGFWWVWPMGGIGRRLEGEGREKPRCFSSSVEEEIAPDSCTTAAFLPWLQSSSCCTGPSWFQLPLADLQNITFSLYSDLGLAVASSSW